MCLALPLNAQMRGVGFASAPHSVARGSFSLRSIPVRAERSFGRRQIFLAGPYFYPDYGFEPAGETAAGPEIVVMQAPPSAPAIEKSPPQALLLEMRGDRFVRVGADEYAPERVPYRFSIVG